MSTNRDDFNDDIVEYDIAMAKKQWGEGRMNAPPRNRDAANLLAETAAPDTTKQSEPKNNLTGIDPQSVGGRGLSHYARLAGLPPPRVRYKLQLRKESTGAVVDFAIYDSLEDWRRVADRLIEAGCPVPILIEVPA